jgi:hypothetical protein
VKRQSKVNTTWTPEFSYAIGLIATDGSLSKDGRHIDFTSKDKELVELFKKCLGLENKIGVKSRGGSKQKNYFRVQFGDKNFYEFLLRIGLTQNKSKTINKLSVPSKYFGDFLRGCIDGDGNIGAHNHPESQHPQLRVRLFSTSPVFLKWVHKQLVITLHLSGGWIGINNRVYGLNYGKADSFKILDFIYYSKVRYYLKRKYIIAKPFLDYKQWAGGEIGKHASLRS